MRPMLKGPAAGKGPGKRLAFHLVWLLLSALLTGSACADMSDEEILRHFKTVPWPQAYRTQDVALLDRLLHDSFQMIDDQGNRSTQQKELARVEESE